MIYRKNLPNWERTLRVGTGLVMIGGGLLLPGLAGSAAGLIVAGAGGAAAATGFVGFCPACAMVGRRVR